MINRQKTLKVYGYDIDPDKKSRRSDDDFAATNGVLKKDLTVVDNCPSCGIERLIKWRQSSKNKPCTKCFHNSPTMLEAKRNQNKVKSEETKQKMSENHWSTKGYKSAFKGQSHTDKVKETLTDKAEKQWAGLTEEQRHELKKKESCTKRGIPLEDFSGFSAPEGTRIRQSAEGKAWTYDILSKANFTCIKCQVRGGSLHAHHLNAFNSYPEQRFNLDNGVCLCHDCHEAFHEVYGKGNNTKEQFDLWLSLP
jgi:predicted RNA-binding Zn-ribbon protein involved in translation (DUF1610 family)